MDMNVPAASIKFGHEHRGGSINVRQTAREADVEALVASIKAEGLLQPIAVWQRDGTYYAVDGNRRLAALKKIGKPVPLSWLHIIEADSIEGAQAKGLAANIMAVPLTPVDRFEAFAALTPKFTTEQIAARYGVTKKAVERSLVLAKLSPVIRTALRKDEIEFEAACAFTIEPDTSRQESIFKKLKTKGKWALRRWDIRDEIMGDATDVASMLKFVGEDAAAASGVTKVEDLFADKGDAPTVVTNIGALEKLVQAKITAAKQQLLKDGWGSVVMADSLEWGWRNWKKTPGAKGADRKKLMVVLELDKGVLKQHLGVTKSKSREVVEKRQEKRKANPNVISKALKDRLQQMMIKATVAAIKAEAWKDPRAAIFAEACAKEMDRHRFVNQMRPEVGKMIGPVRDFIAHDVMEAAQLKAFDAKDYFPRAPKNLVLKAIEEAGVTAPADLKTKTKSAIWKFALASVPKTGWLPPELRWKGYAGPKPKKG